MVWYGDELRGTWGGPVPLGILCLEARNERRQARCKRNEEQRTLSSALL